MHSNVLSLGVVPTAMPSSLTYLDLSFNSLHGTLPDTTCTLVNLIYLFMNSNSFHGPIPSNIGDLTSIISLQLNDNCFSGTIPSSIGLLVALGELELQNNAFTGSVPDSFCNLNSLYIVYICDNNVDSAGCPFLSSVPYCFYEFPLQYKLFGNLTVSTPTPTTAPSLSPLGMSTCCSS